MDYYIHIGWSTQRCATTLAITSQHHIPINIPFTYVATEPFGLPETGKGSKAYYCGQEIGPIWYFSSELLKLETTERHAKEILDRLAAIKAEAQKWRST